MDSIFLLQCTTVYPKKYAHGFCFAVLCCGYTLTDFPISIRLISLALWQSNDCPSASKATLMNMDKYFMWIHYERLHNHNKAKHNKTVSIFLGIYCTFLAYAIWDRTECIKRIYKNLKWILSMVIQVTWQHDQKSIEEIQMQMWTLHEWKYVIRVLNIKKKDYHIRRDSWVLHVNPYNIKVMRTKW